MDYKSLVKHNKALLIFTSAVFLCMVVGWILYALYAHQLIKVIYEGRVGFLNRTISEQAVNSLGFYLRKADTAFIKLHICFFISIALYIFRIMAKNKIWRLLSVLLIYFIVAFLVLHTFMLNWGFNGDHPRYGFNQMMTYTAHKPFAYRVLTPILINLSSSLIPESVIRSNEKWLTKDSPVVKYVQIKKFWNGRISFKYHLTYLYLFLCLILLLFSMRYLTKVIYDPSALVSDLSPAIGLLFLPLTFLYGGYFYDFPELLFMGLGLICLIKQKWIFYYIVFILATLNKESNVLLVLFFTAFCWKNLSKKRFLKHLIVQIFIGGIIIILIRNVFATNPGEAIETYHLKDNISFWSSPRSYFLFFDPYYLGLPIFPRGGNILSILFVVFLVFYKWREKPLSVKRLFIYTFIINLPLFIYACHRDELRNFSLVFPSIFLLGVHTAYNLIHKKA